MTTQELQTRLQIIDPKFTIINHPVNNELAGLYYDRNEQNKTGFVVTVPAGLIKEDFDPAYTDMTGHPHNWASKIEFVAKEHIRRLKDEEGYAENFYEPLPTAPKI